MPVEGLQLLPPLTRPGKIICIGLNYRAHAEEQGKEPPETPTFFAKFRNALAAPGATVPLPPWSERVDYEAEVAFVLEDRCKDVPESEAMDHVAGYTLLNDLSARDYQFKTPQWMPGKTFDGAAPCGPALVTPDEAGPHDAIEIELTLNGELMQSELDRRPRPLGARARGVPVAADDARAGRHRLDRHARRGGQPARPQGVAEAGRRGRDQLAAARRARDAAGLGLDLDVAAERLGQQVGVPARGPDRDGGVAVRVGLRLERHGAAVRRDAHVRDRAVAAPLQLLGEPDHAAQEAEPVVVAGLGEVAEVGRVGLALAVIARDQPDQDQLARA